MNTILFGIKGCGKSFIGSALAKRRGWPFIDTDRLIEKAYEKSDHKRATCHEIYLDMGKDFFRSLEERVIHLLAAQHTVIAVGGGAMLNQKNVQALLKHGELIYLYLTHDLLKMRVLSKTPLPSFIDSKDPEASFEALYEERDAIYSKLPALKIDMSQMTTESILSEINKRTCYGK